MKELLRAIVLPYSINLCELTLENVGKWPVAIKKGVAAGIGFLSFILGYCFFIQASFEQLDTLKIQEITLKQDFETKQFQASNAQGYRKQLHLIKERFESMLQLLPDKNEMPDLLKEISKAGVRSGLKFELFAPQPEVTRDFYVELPIKISLVGTYMQLAVFISRVAEMARIVTLHEFSIVRAPISTGKIYLENDLVMNITAKIYRYRTQ